MIVGVMVCLCFAAGGQFEITSIDLASKDTSITRVYGDRRVDFLVRDGNTLRLYSNPALEPGPELTLEEGTTCFDVADINDDGRNEVIAIKGDRIVEYALPDKGKDSSSDWAGSKPALRKDSSPDWAGSKPALRQAAPPPKELFSLHTLFSDPGKDPYPYSFMTWKDDRVLLALPLENALELRGLDGSLVASYPLAPRDPKRPDDWGSFSAETVYPSVTGHPGAIEYKISCSLRGVPQLPDQPQKPERSYGRMYDANSPESWPSFPLKDSKDELRRVFYSSSEGDDMETRICIGSNPPPDNPAPEQKDLALGRVRKYPGQLMTTSWNPPDFNHDGYNDILLWKTSPPGRSVDALTRAISGGSWPVDLKVHLYSPEKDRYEPVPASITQCLVSIARFLTMQRFDQNPLTNVMFDDFDGDGRTDFGCSSWDTTFCIWLYKENGFPMKPDFTLSSSDRSRLLHITPMDFDGDGHGDLGACTSKTTYSIWLWKENGFSSDPDFVQTFPGDITKRGIEFTFILSESDKKAQPVLCVRTDQNFFLLRAKQQHGPASDHQNPQ